MTLTKEDFTKLIKEYQAWDKYIDKVEECDIEIINSPLYDYPTSQMDLILKMAFTEKGVDLIWWWMLEKEPGVDSMWDKEGNVIPMETLDDLWRELQDYLK